MHETNIQAVREEVLRLIWAQHKMLSDLLLAPDLLKSSADQQKRNLDRELAERWIEALETEAKKVERLEMTLAVVGTMKAGKSTTINAIVGTEVLPNRNLPMTTLPTLVRHAPGKTSPVLTFSTPQPFNDALLAIRKRLHALQKAGTLEKTMFYSSSEDGRQLISDILSERFAAIATSYNGTESIFNFLKAINDISRLCDDDDIQVPSPLAHYDSIDEFPLIEVEFFHLRNTSHGTLGKFTLVDTPGPNEAGKSQRLKQILNEQLEQASAVLAVLDYNQLNSQADAEIRGAVEEIFANSLERLFVLVNRFDERNSRSLDEDEVRQYVLNHLFDGLELVPDRIHPVSSSYAYLANRALLALESDERLPDPEAEPWVKDFGEQAMGRCWDEDIEDGATVRKAALRLWRDSLFEQPLAQVILKSSNRAAFFSLEAAMAKMVEYDRETLHCLEIRRGGLKSEVKEVQAHINALEADIKRIQATREVAYRTAGQSVEQFTQMMDVLFETTTDQIVHQLEVLLAIRKEEERRELAVREEDKRKERLANSPMNLFGPAFLSRITSLTAPPSSRERSKLEIDPDGPNRFDSRDEAEHFLKTIGRHIETTIDGWTEKTQRATEAQLRAIEHQLWQEIEAIVKPVLEEASQRLDQTFNAKLSFPTPSLATIQMNFDRIAGADIQTTTETRYRTIKERRWYTLWLWEHDKTVAYDKEIHQVDARRIGADVIKNLGQENGKLKKSIRRFSEKELKAKIDQYLDELTSYLEGYRGTLLDAKQDHAKAQKVLEQLASTMAQLIPKAKEHAEDVSSIREALSAHQGATEKQSV